MAKERNYVAMWACLRKAGPHEAKPTPQTLEEWVYCADCIDEPRPCNNCELVGALRLKQR